MMKTIFAAILAITVMAPSTPTFTYNNDGTATAKFDAGAVWANISYASHTQTYEQEGKQVPYVFYDNYQLSENLTEFTEELADVQCTTPKGDVCPDGDDWDITLSVGYPHESKTVPGVIDVEYVESAVLTLHKDN